MWALSETVQKISKITYTASHAVLTFDERQICIERLNRVTLQHNKEFIMFIFFI